jgi:hypothetical protein
MWYGSEAATGAGPGARGTELRAAGAGAHTPPVGGGDAIPTARDQQSKVLRSRYFNDDSRNVDDEIIFSPRIYTNTDRYKFVFIWSVVSRNLSVNILTLQVELSIYKGLHVRSSQLQNNIRLDRITFISGFV